MLHREGFVCAGTWLMEQIKSVEQYPGEGQHAVIMHEHSRPGGSAFEMISALRRRDAALPLYALGSIGEDENGHELLSACHKQEVDTFQVHVTPEAPTAHAVDIHARDNHSRTRFYFPGANNLLSAEHFDFRHCLASWCHLSEADLLERLQQHDQEFGIVMGRVLHQARAAGLVTALTWATCQKTTGLRSMLQTLDYLIIDSHALNALIGRAVDGAEPTPRRAAATDLFQLGLQSGLAIIFTEGVFAKLRSGEEAWLTSPQVATTASRSATIFSAGFLYGRYSGWELERCLTAALAS